MCGYNFVKFSFLIELFYRLILFKLVPILFWNVRLLTFDSFMYWWNMCNKVRFLWKVSRANITMIWVFSSMNWFNMCIKALFCCKSNITIDTLERLNFLMDWWNMVIQVGFFFEKLAAHKLHLKGFFPSWTVEMCLLRCCFLLKAASQVVHWKGLI